MKPRDVERFFRALARAWPFPADCILIGGAAAVVEGSLRPTDDVDFEVAFGGDISSEDSELFAGAVHDAERASGFGGQFTEDIGPWSTVALPPYRNRTRPWKRFGPIAVRLLDPASYTVTKLCRGAAHDFEDVVFVSGRRRVAWGTVARACGIAVRSSPRSTRLRAFVRRVEYLFRTHGRKLWGRRFDPEAAIRLFRRESARRTHL